ncbi:MAG: hypothetical protein ABSG75_11565 [Syntrophales bacterium]|jgi:hypothetical protein
MEDEIILDNTLKDGVFTSVEKFIQWIDRYGETSYDHQSFFAGPFGGKAKALYYKHALLGTMAVSPMILFEAFVPSARKLFWKKQRFPIADAHYAMGFALLTEITGKEKYYHRAVHFLEALKNSRSPGFKHYCWGYPFDWVTRNGTIPANSPFITTLPYVYEAFEYVYAIDKNEQWLEIMHSIAEHSVQDIQDFKVSQGAYSCGYGPYDDKGGVINASAYRAFLLTAAGKQFSNEQYLKIAQGNVNFVIQSQQENGSWYYASDSVRDFVDHFHTCFILKALVKIQQLTGHKGCEAAIEKGVKYYLANLFDEHGRPKPFSKAPRLTVYRNELYDYAECINLGVLLKNRFNELDERIIDVIQDLLNQWRKPDGSFRSRKLLIGWDNVPMHRWAQSQLFRSLCFLLYREKQVN